MKLINELGQEVDTTAMLTVAQFESAMYLNKSHPIDTVQRLSNQWRLLSNQEKLEHMRWLREDLGIHITEMDAEVFQARDVDRISRGLFQSTMSTGPK